VELKFSEAELETLAYLLAEKVISRLNTPGNKKVEDILYDVQGLSQYLHVSIKWIYERTHLKEIPYIKIKGHLLFRKRDIDRWLDSHKTPAARLPTNLRVLNKRVTC